MLEREKKMKLKLFSVFLLVFTPFVIGIFMGPVFDMFIKKLVTVLSLLRTKGGK